MKGLSSPYELIDSGGLQKLERFGERLLVRPSSLSVWERREGASIWGNADAVFEPKKGWRFSSAEFADWRLELDGAHLGLSLQNNGQIGFFPEHATYAGEAQEALTGLAGAAPEALNLFAYTGLATIWCAKRGVKVTHVDIAKRALDWAAANLEANSISRDLVRLIREDARSFVKKELKRGRVYDVVIADPPAFSRVSDKDTWQLDSVLKELVDGCVKLLNPKKGVLLFTSHYYEFGEMVIANLVQDAMAHRGLRAEDVSIRSSQLALNESGTGRRLPAGFLVSCRIAT